MNHSPPLFLTIAPKLAEIRLLSDLWSEDGNDRAANIHQLVDQIALDAAAVHLDAGLRYDPLQDRFTRDAPAGNQTREEYIRDQLQAQQRWVQETLSRRAPSMVKHMLAIGCITQDEYDAVAAGWT